MIVYSGTKSQFQQDGMSNDNPNPAMYGRVPRSSGFRTKRYARSVRKGVCRPEGAPAMRGVSSSRNLPAIGGIIYNAYQGATGHRTSRAEITAWTNSLQYMDRVLGDPGIPNDAGVAIEYHINPNPAEHGRVPRSSGSRAKRYARQAREGICRPAGAPAMRGVSSSRNLPAPRSLGGYNLYPCAYLHNYEPDNVITNPFYKEYTDAAPVFLKPDAVKLQVRPGFRARHNYASRPGRKAGGDFSTKIAEAGSRKTAMRFMRDFIKLRGNQELVMVDDQKIVYETALALAAKAATGANQS